MQKAAPSIGRILIAVGFALSCFGLLLFLWVAFGGPVPLKSKSYRITAYFPEATQLATESDVRIGGVSVGKVKTTALAPVDKQIDGQDTSEAVIEIEPQFAPISSDAEAILRQKTLLGETYVELTSGTNPGDEGAPISLGAAANNTDAEVAGVESIPEDGTLGLGQVRNQTQIDEIFNALDSETRKAFQQWQQNAAVAIQSRGLDLNDSLGNLGPFLTDASDVIGILREQKQQLQALVRDTGTVFEALTERNQALAGTITGSNNTFDALASEEAALRETFQVFPTFERESRLTFERLDAFQENTRPLIQDLLPVANDISPTLRSVRELSPNLKSLFIDLGELIKVSKKGLPALREFLIGLGPVMDALDPFLANLNPVVSWLNYYKTSVTDFLAGPPAALSGTLPVLPGQPAPRHSLRQISYTSAESLSIYPTRSATNRGNGYMPPYDQIIADRRAAIEGMFPNFDCDPSGGERTVGDGGSPAISSAFAPCILSDDFPGRFGGGKGPQLTADP